ncbi:hypothetical protein Lser_V15G06695 [Lactuca serriola]
MKKWWSLVIEVDNDLALKIYIKARATPKVVAAFAERREFDKILIYSKQVGYSPDYLFLLQTILRSDPQGAVNFALMMSQMEGGCPVDYNTITDLFLQRNLIREATAFLLDVLKTNLPEHAHLQTKVLEINLVTFPNVPDAILANGMFSHYDRPRIAQLCEKAGLYVRALQHYNELPDIKRVILLINLRGNLQIIVQVAKEYCEQLGVESCIKIFEQFKSYEGLYFFLGSYLSSSEDPDIHFKYIEAAAKTGQIKEVERVTRESNFYDAEKTKNFLMEAKLPDARPLINVCDRFGFVPDLTHYLYTNNMLQYIEGYVQKVNPGNAPLVVGQLLDDECPEDFMKGLILSVRSLLPVQPLVDECEKRNRLRLLTQFLEHLFIIGDGTNMYDFTYVENVAHAHVCAERALASDGSASKRAAGEAYFITNMEPIKFWEFMSLILVGLGFEWYILDFWFVFKFLAKTLDVVQDIDWVISLGNAFAKQYELYTYDDEHSALLHRAYFGAGLSGVLAWCVRVGRNQPNAPGVLAPSIFTSYVSRVLFNALAVFALREINLSKVTFSTTTFYLSR